MSKRNIILIEHRPDLRAIYGLNLTVYIEANVIVAMTVKEALDILSKEESVALIFVDSGAYSIDIGLELYQGIKNGKKRAPLFVVGTTKAPSADVTIFDSKSPLKSILQSIAKAVGVTAQNLASEDVPKYYPLPMEFIVPGWFCITNVFIQKGGEYTPVFADESVITCDSLDELESQGVTTLYVLANQRARFVNALTHQIKAKLNNSSLTFEERVKTTALGYQMVMETARQVGVSESTMELADKCIDSMKAIVETAPGLDQLLKNFTQDQKGYRYRVSLLSNYIGTHLVKKMDWGSKQQQETLSFVCFFSDISLLKDEYARFHTDQEVMASSLPEKDKKHILSHALLSASIVSKIPKHPYGADTIIKQHHGAKDGKSLSEVALSISFSFSLKNGPKSSSIALKTINPSKRTPSSPGFRRSIISRPLRK